MREIHFPLFNYDGSTFWKWFRAKFCLLQNRSTKATLLLEQTSFKWTKWTKMTDALTFWISANAGWTLFFHGVDPWNEPCAFLSDFYRFFRFSWINARSQFWRVGNSQRILNYNWYLLNVRRSGSFIGFSVQIHSARGHSLSWSKKTVASLGNIWNWVLLVKLRGTTQLFNCEPTRHSLPVIAALLSFCLKQLKVGLEIAASARILVSVDREKSEVDEFTVNRKYAREFKFWTIWSSSQVFHSSLGSQSNWNSLIPMRGHMMLKERQPQTTEHRRKKTKIFIDLL